MTQELIQKLERYAIDIDGVKHYPAKLVLPLLGYKNVSQTLRTHNITALRHTIEVVDSLLVVRKRDCYVITMQDIQQLTSAKKTRSSREYSIAQATKLADEIKGKIAAKQVRLDEIMSDEEEQLENEAHIAEETELAALDKDEEIEQLEAEYEEALKQYLIDAEKKFNAKFGLDKKKAKINHKFQVKIAAINQKYQSSTFIERDKLKAEINNLNEKRKAILMSAGYKVSE